MVLAARHFGSIEARFNREALPGTYDTMTGAEG